MMFMTNDGHNRVGADAIADWIRHSLHGVFDDVLNEQLPPELMDVLDQDEAKPAPNRQH